jgi:para-aminobenzoate synthetase
MIGTLARVECSIKSRVLMVAELSLGAGGAITWLSNPEGEWDEVLTKVKSVVGTVQVV